jgi:twitching motility protein PilT
MARLDPIIEKLFKESGHELTIETGGGVNMRTGSAVQPVLKQNLTSLQILGALAELVPVEQRANFPPEGFSSFSYTAPAGPVQVRLENAQGTVKVSVVPFAEVPAPATAGEEKFELASPVEMLEMAAQATSVALDPGDDVPLELEPPAVTAAAIPVAPPTPVPVPAPAAPVQPAPARPLTMVPVPSAARAAPVTPVPLPHGAHAAPAGPPVVAAAAHAPPGPAPVPPGAAHAPAPARVPGPATMPPVPMGAVPGPATMPPVAAAPAPARAVGPVTMPPVPATPPAPATPAARGAPAAPAVQAVAAAPATPAVQAAPAIPPEPATPVVLIVPPAAAMPVASSVPAAPVTPAVPVTPAAHAAPVTPAAHTVPTTPAAHTVPATPAAHTVPATPAAQAVAATPPVPATPAVQSAPATTAVQAVPVAAAPAAPAPAPVSPPTLVPVSESAARAPTPHLVPEDAKDHREEAEAQMLAMMDAMLARGASDLHLSSETVPHMRIDGDMVAVEEYGRVTHERLKAMIFSVAPEKNRRQWEEFHDTDFAYETAAARFRVNVFEDRKGIGAVLRQIPNTIRTAEEIGLTKHVLDLCFLSKGLVLVTGPTGSGKSTTLAALIDYVNRHREDHIITVEDPIEFVHKNKNCLVNQREVGVHTHSFKNALRAALREDPDVVLVGEMRDLETIATAIETAETGHLVFGTLHTNTAASTVDRIIDQFPADRQAQIRMMLSESLKAVIAQTLCKRAGGGRVAAQEVLLVTGSVSNLIREGKTFQIPSVMQTSRGQGMVMLNDALLDLVKRKVVEPNEALSKSVARAELRAMLERAGFKVDTPVEPTAPTK